MNAKDAAYTPAGIADAVFVEYQAGFISLKAFCRRLSALRRQQLDLGLSADQNKIQMALSDLPAPYQFHKYGQALYLLNGPIADVLADYVQRKPGKTFKQLNQVFPLKAGLLLTHVNRLADAGRIKIKISASGKPMLFTDAPATPAVAEQKPEPPAVDTPVAQPHSLKQFKQAHDRVGKGARYVFIHEIRRCLQWPRRAFDAMMRQLMDQGTVAAHPGNPGALSAEAVADAYRDEFGDLYLTLTWRKDSSIN